ncbi:D-aminoacyl-tRNA deacylase [Anaerotignum propionicum]|jgi:D-tyrosyl-tRNA(Tyr) deacylase|uniref:D-aminoacyl-tRNA deacylase n=1 Tax=Anaerotignum propionicum DSM 1682 TaxID=991789 RepID=A0A110A6V6_ANAPI|nr:D-aminoacyl-tRNA deacylase [Anaerotignum propionicum]AMJ40047.1 D-tyrosyl-tRNA(Tyr) deacylase [Anaerotignum propionicum DSM 1682]SHE79397.1 D-tyrosyl-tRNA(Tyr) deacylase [[Clostridium] propionicum DSM 1682] [Anaerotignum propionicum DSM 1682]HBF65047.1 D-tyrosyl-tRNA(Tyr) deacylase [Clostridium sp.]
MRGVLQRVTSASVTVDGQVIGEIGKGIMVLFGMLGTDDEKTMEYMLDKVVNLRIFEDENGKMNLSLLDIGGELLIVPNFTLYGDSRKGRRPGYSSGAAPDVAAGLFERLCEKAKEMPIKKVATGQFQADMKVALVNDGPVTLLLDSEKLF